MILPGRKHPPHLPSLSRVTTILLLTICTKDRRKLLANEPVHQLLRRAWIENNEYPVGRYVILPEHIHVFVGENHMARYPLSNWVAAWKTYVTLRWPRPNDRPIWQRSFWDRQIRSSDGYDGKWFYVRLNPVRHGLVEHPDDWQFHGMINILSW